MVLSCLFSQMFILLLLWPCNEFFFPVYFGFMPFIIIKRGGLGLEMEFGSGLPETLGIKGIFMR